MSIDYRVQAQSNLRIDITDDLKFATGFKVSV